MKRRLPWLGIWAALFLGVTFVVAGAGKVFVKSNNFEPFTLPDFVPVFLGEAIYAVVPYVELVIGVLLIMGIAVKVVTSFSALLIVGFIVSNILLITLGGALEPCGCFGGIVGGLSVQGSLGLDAVMAGAVAIILRYYPGSFNSITPWMLTNTPALKGVASENV